jgi:membrane-associated phospholipid phosphatase
MRLSSEVRLTALVVIITIGFAAVDVWWSPASKITLDPQSWIEFAKIMALLCVLFFGMKAIERRLIADKSKPGRAISYAAESLRWMIVNAALFIPLGFASVYFMYLAEATDTPLMDAALARLDGMVGFDWLSFLALMNAHPWIARSLVFAYNALGTQLPLLFIVLGFVDRLRLTEFMATLAVSSALSAIGLAFVPAAGAYAYFQPAVADFTNFTHAGFGHLNELMKIRSGEPMSLLVTRAEGLVTFPSYHTALGIIVTYALRKKPFIAWPIGILNAVMLVSTLPEGGHHLTDVIAGAAIGAASCWAVWATQAIQSQKDLRIKVERV